MRLDVYLTKQGLAKSRSYAKELIISSCVTVDGSTVVKPSYEVDGERVEVVGELYTYVGRGGVKLEAALDSFGIDVCGMVAADIGASTGGFTDCLIKRGAKRVFAVDSGHGQLSDVLLRDERVVNLEGFNARQLTRDDLGEPCDIVVCDVSFISQTLLHGAISSVMKDNGFFISLIKPQFECGASAIGKGGIVKSARCHMSAISKVIESALSHDLGAASVIPSPVKGGDGNREFLALFIKGAGCCVGDKEIKEAIGK